MINEILNFIAKYTYHVLDEYGRSAKIPISLIKREFEFKFKSWQTIMKILKNKGWITDFNWGELKQDNNTIRITGKGQFSTRLDILFERPNHKRILLWYEENPVLVDYKDWSKLDFYYNNEGIIVYKDKLKLTKLMMGIKGNIE